MNYNDIACPVGFDVMRPRKSEDGRIEIEVGFFFKNKEKGAFIESEHTGRTEKCQDAVRHLLRDEKANRAFEEFIKYDALQRMVK